MNIKSFFAKLYRAICKDTGSQNESSKLISVVRLLTLTMMFYSLANSIITTFTSSSKDVVISGISFVLFLAIFISSYHCKPFTAYCSLNGYVIIWVVINILFYGWDIGVQHFIITLLVFCFFAKYGHEVPKLFYAAFLFALRIFLYYYCRLNEPYIAIAEEVNNTFQIVNTLFVFISLTLVAYFFSKDSQVLEGKLIEYNEQLIEQASIDPLTGLHNRRSTMKYLEKLLLNPKSQISICICDIDLFKRVNDTYGHDIGDIVLKEIAKTFQSALPHDSFLSRWGGEEFLLIFPRSNGDDALVSLETLRHKIKAIAFHGGEEEFHVSLTFGLVEYDFHSDLTTILKEADEKLYYGKEHGRDQIVY